MKIINNKLYEEVDNGIFKYDKPSKTEIVVAKEPMAQWLGAKFPYDQWKQIIGFFIASFEKTKAESMVRMYYNQELKAWKTHAFPQEYSGLAVTDETDDKQFERYVGDGFVLAATAHHHCHISASQSSRDEKDETTKNGVHITVGNLDKFPLDFHCRISISKKMFASEIDDFIDIPMDVFGDIKVNQEFIDAYKEQMLCQSSEYPKIWMDNVREKKYTAPAPSPIVYGKEDAFDKFETNYLGRRPYNTTEYNSAIDYQEMKNEAEDMTVELEHAQAITDELASIIFDPTTSDSDKIWALEQTLSRQSVM